MSKLATLAVVYLFLFIVPMALVPDAIPESSGLDYVSEEKDNTTNETSYSVNESFKEDLNDSFAQGPSNILDSVGFMYFWIKKTMAFIGDLINILLLPMHLFDYVQTQGMPSQFAMMIYWIYLIPLGVFFVDWLRGGY